MSLQLPFALIPLLTFVCSERDMGDFKGKIWTKLIASTLSVIVIGINLYFVSTFVSENLPRQWFVYLLSTIFAFCYIGFNLYLVACLLVVFGVNFIAQLPVIGKYFILRNMELKPMSPSCSDDSLASDAKDSENDL